MPQKVYKQIYSGSGGSNLRHKPAITISAGRSKTIPLKIGASQGRIAFLAIKQESGPLVDFVVELLDSKRPYYAIADVAGELPLSTPPATHVEFYRIIPQQVASAGAAVQLIEQIGYNFHNLDQLSETNPERLVYLSIFPVNATAPTSWGVSVMIVRNEV